MPWFLTLFLFVGFTVLSELLRPKPKFGAPQPSGIGDFQVPTAQEGRAIPVVFGTVKLAGPNVVWYGDLAVIPVQKKVKTGIFSSDKVTTGYRYYVGMQLALCHGPIDELIEVRWDDRPVPYALEVQHVNPIIDLHTPAGVNNELGSNVDTWRSVDEPGIPNDHDFIAAARLGGSSSFFNYRLRTATDPGINTGHILRIRLRVPLDDPFNPTDHLIAGLSVGTTDILDFTNINWPGPHVTPTLTDMPTGDFITFEYHLSEVEAAKIRTLPGGYADLRVAGLYYTGFDGSTSWQSSWIDLEVPAVPVVSVGADVIQALFNAPTQFGGDEREGGVIGAMDFYRGTLTQTADDYLKSKLGVVDLPAYRGVCYAVFKGGRVATGGSFFKYVTIPGFYFGTTPYMKVISFVLRRCPNTLGLAGGKENVSGDANPAAMLYEILTNGRWGLGLSTSQIDTASFTSAADVLYSEGFGLSMIVDQGSSARDLINEIQRHIDAVMYTDTATGLIVLRLIRADYGPGDPIALNVDNVISCKIGRPAWPDTRNLVKVRYTDRAGNFTQRVVQARDSANLQIQGEQSSEEFDFRGISNAAIAQKRCEQLLRVVSYPLAPIELEVNRAAWTMRPGSVGRLTWAPLGITDLAFRCTRISNGELADGRIRVDGIEDVFGIQGTAFAAPGTSGWDDPITEPSDLAAARLFEVPYALVVGPDRMVGALGARSTSVQLGYQVWADPTGGSNYAFTSEVRELTPAPVLAAAVNFTTTSLQIVSEAILSTLVSASTGEFALGKNLVLIGDELIAWKDIFDNEDGTHTLSGCVRGVADTVPAEHGIGVRVWMISEGSGLAIRSPLGADVTIAAKLLAFTSLGLQLLDDVDAITLVLNSRALRPYVPRDVLINAGAYPSIVGTGDITVAWTHRNRLSEWSWATGGSAGSPEAGTTYNLRFYKDGDVLAKSYTGLTGTSQAWTTETADVGYRSDSVRIELEAVVGGVVSFQMFNYTVWRNMANSASKPDLAAIAARRRRPYVRRVWNDNSDPS